MPGSAAAAAVNWFAAEASAITTAQGATVETTEDVVAQVVLTHDFGDFAVATAAEEGLEDGGHAAVAAAAARGHLKAAA